MSDPATSILLADDDADIRAFLELTLQLAGFVVRSAADGVEAVASAQQDPPDVVLLDVMMPNLDGLAATRELRADPRTSDLPIILVTAKAQGMDKVVGLGEGADDYVTKPFDPDELVARVRAALRRSAAMRQVSPLSGLPGNTRIEAEIERRTSSGERFALLYCDLNMFKAFNDHYGFMEGDRVLRGFAQLLREVVAEIAPRSTFVGHVGGDDFVLVTDHQHHEALAVAVTSRFDALAPSFYAPVDRAHGTIRVENRQGETVEVPFVSVAVGVVHNNDRELGHPGEVVALATEMKHVAKRDGGDRSSWAVDRRTSR